MTVSPSRTVIRLLVAALVALSLAGCARSPDAAPAPTATPIDLADLLRRSGAAMGALDTFHFRLEHNSAGGTPLSETLTVTEAQGSVANPDRLSVEFAGTLGSFAVRSSLITLGEDSYMTNPLTGAWERTPREVSPLGFFSPQRGIGAIMAEVRAPSLVSHSDGAFEIAGTLPVSALESLLGGAARGDTVGVRLAIDDDTLFLTRAVIDGRVTDIEAGGVVRTITLSKFNERVIIEPPE